MRDTEAVIRSSTFSKGGNYDLKGGALNFEGSNLTIDETMFNGNIAA